MTDKVKSNDEINFKINQTIEGKKYDKIQDLIKLCEVNENFYKNDKTFAGTRMCMAFEKLNENLIKAEPVLREVDGFAYTYDYDESTPGNGYRSFIFIFESALDYSMKTCQYINDNRGSLLFRKSNYLKELDVSSQMIESLLQIIECLIEMHKNSDNGNLYSKEYSHDNMITRNADKVNQTCFYGRSIGFQYADSLKTLLRYINVALASFSESYYMNSAMVMKTTNYFLKQPIYFMDPELCAKRIMNVSRNCDVKFCKSWWWMAENKFLQVLPQLVGYKVEVNKVFKLPPEPMKVFSKKFNKFVDVKIPHSHTGPGPVSCRLISAKKRIGMVGEKNSNGNLAEPSKYLIIHSHGGGWIANSSKSHEFYLREWAVKLDVPILSIDYSLGPKAPFPRGLEDVFYTYCWALNNHKLLGTTAENIVLVGDSAGANLNTGCLIKCIEQGIPLPKGILNIYAPFLVNFASTPARFLTFVDPLVPYGFIMRIFKAYGGTKSLADDVIGSMPQNDPNPTHEIITDVHDDNSEILLSPESKKDMESMWLKIKDSTEIPEWHRNLSSIEEKSANDSSASIERKNSFQFGESSNSDEIYDGLEITNSKRRNSEEVKLSTSQEDEKPPMRPRLNSRTPSEENVIFDVIKESLSVQNFQIKNQSASTKIENSTKNNQNETIEQNDTLVEKNKDFSDVPVAPEGEFVFTVPKNYLMSPYLASDELLMQFPRTNIVTTIVDPCIDDCVEFSKKLKSLKVNIQVDILGALNHGFLNFAGLSKDCHDASMLCMRRLANLLELEAEINN